jgi:hypothetical protein
MNGRRFMLLVLAGLTLAVLNGCDGNGGEPPPTGPGADANAPLYGVWIGGLAGPEIIQRSGWSPKCRDSLWVVIGPRLVKYWMSPAAGAESSLAKPPDTCFVRRAAAVNRLAEPHVSFRVNFHSYRVGWEAVTFTGARDGDSIIGTLTLPGDTVAGRWSLTRCASCADSAKQCP